MDTCLCVTPRGVGKSVKRSAGRGATGSPSQFGAFRTRRNALIFHNLSILLILTEIARNYLGNRSMETVSEARFDPWHRIRRPGNGRNLLKWPEKFQPEETHIPRNLLPEDPGGDGRGFVGHQAGRSGRRRGHGQVDRLIRAQQVSRGNTSAG